MRGRENSCHFKLLYYLWNVLVELQLLLVFLGPCAPIYFTVRKKSRKLIKNRCTGNIHLFHLVAKSRNLKAIRFSNFTAVHFWERFTKETQREIKREEVCVREREREIESKQNLLFVKSMEKVKWNDITVSQTN